MQSSSGAPPNMPLSVALAWLSDVIFALLFLFNAHRLLRHVLWRDEMQAFMLSLSSGSPLDLFAKLKYEGHPGLWHLLLWIVTRVSSDPACMQWLQLAIALGIWVLVWRATPFSIIEKLLLLLSYFLFFEYFVMSRCYALGVLLGFGFIALSLYRPRQRFWPFVLLGLLANCTLFGTIWSMVLAAFFVFKRRENWRGLLPGIAVYAGLAALAVATLVPAPDFKFVFSSQPSFTVNRIDLPLHFVLGAFFPFPLPFTLLSLKWLGGAFAALTKIGFFVDPLGFVFKLAVAYPPLGWTILVLPLGACAAIVRNRMLFLEYAAVYIGILLFAEFWQYPGAARHHGYLFVALVGVVWMAREVAAPVRVLWIVLLVINALGGIATLSSELKPFSQSRNTAKWIERHGLADTFLIGSRDATSSPVSGYLGRPLYYLECECFGSYIKWSTARTPKLSLSEFLDRTARALESQRQDKATVIVSQPFDLENQTLRPNLSFKRVKSMGDALIGDETYRIYALTLRPKDGGTPQ